MNDSNLPTISVVIPTFNCAGYIGRALDSVFSQDYAPLEVIIVDDGSTDDTIAALEPYNDRIRLLRQANAGSAAARNAGLAQATGEFVALLDADDWFLPNKFHTQAAMLAADPSLAAVHSGWRIVDEDGSWRKDVEPWRVAPNLSLAELLKWKPVKMGAMLFR
ncbi:MAG: glycosyltransferase family 2 protein, partial [Planctomycetales bacterium]|nr:glycosyltransferase family 2 protein [Planctomycetales bacterium]